MAHLLPRWAPDLGGRSSPPRPALRSCFAVRPPGGARGPVSRSPGPARVEGAAGSGQGCRPRSCPRDAGQVAAAPLAAASAPELCVVLVLGAMTHHTATTRSDGSLWRPVDLASDSPLGVGGPAGPSQAGSAHLPTAHVASHHQGGAGWPGRQGSPAVRPHLYTGWSLPPGQLSSTFTSKPNATSCPLPRVLTLWAPRRSGLGQIPTPRSAELADPSPILCSRAPLGLLCFEV